MEIYLVTCEAKKVQSSKASSKTGFFPSGSNVGDHHLGKSFLSRRS